MTALACMTRKEIGDIVDKLEYAISIRDESTVKHCIGDLRKQFCEEIKYEQHLSVRHYVGNDHPTLRGFGNELSINEEREDVEDFAEAINIALHGK